MTMPPHPAGDAGRAVSVADLRLLGPALCGWVGVAVFLPAPQVTLTAAFALLSLATAILLWGSRRRSTADPARRSRASAVALCTAATALVLLATTMQRELRAVGPISKLAQEGASVQLRADVASDPVLLPANGNRRTPLVMVRLQVHQVIGRGASSAVGTPVLAFADQSWASLRWGAEVEVRGRLAPARRGDDVVATLSGKGFPTLRAPPGAVQRAAGALRSGLQRAVQGAPGEGAGLLPGLVVGDTSHLDPGLEQDMRTAGLTHLVAVSGSNVAIVCGAVLLLARRLGLRRRLRAPLAGLTLVAFVVVARPEPSVLRAAVMGGIGLVGLATARRAHGIPALSAAVLGLLSWDPWLARSYGFALSVLATLGLLLFARPLGDWLSKWLPRPLGFALAVPLAAQAACGPVIVLVQGSVSLVSVPANLLAAPFVAPATIAGVVAATLSAGSASAAHMVAWCGVLPADGITGVARLAGRVPSLPWPGGWAGAIALAVATCAAALGARPAARACARYPWAATALVPVLVAGVWPTGTLGWPPPGWVMVMCDVGQGDGLVLHTSNGHAIVVDTGPDPGLMDGCLRRLGVRVVDLLVLTHDHADHVEGVPGVLRGRRVGQLLLNGLDDPPAEARRIAGWAARAEVPVRRAEVGASGRIGPVQWQVLWPAWVIHEGSTPNNDSIVLLVRSSGLRLLLLGDVETPAARQVDRALRALPGGPRVDVLKVAHHGSALQDPGLVQDADASLALVSVGVDNDYGHPAQSTLNLLRGTGATVRRTDQDGDIAVVSRSGRLAVVTHPP
jgi:competence protein ComEC